MTSHAKRGEIKHTNCLVSLNLTQMRPSNKPDTNDEQDKIYYKVLGTNLARKRIFSSVSFYMPDTTRLFSLYVLQQNKQTAYLQCAGQDDFPH